ncbi:MAG: twin transmembrane helix small protein [Gammaproteobacteria bacterium]|nr:twin transmembrane helix small protein [Gammaproteobacteria bacterium]
MLIKTIFIIAFAAILISLGSALYHIVVRKPEDRSDKAVKALTVRISLSIVLFVLLFLAMAFGLLKPQGIGSVIHAKKPPHAEQSR